MEQVTETVYRALPKWPRLVVVSKMERRLTEAEVNEVLLRTTCVSYLSCNDKEFALSVHRVLGLESDDIAYPTWQSAEALRERIGSLDLEYLYNSRLLSSYIGGPHGWLDWDGNLGCGSYSIGKWPSIDSVRAEWEQIAKAFPYLSLNSQLFSGECSDSPGEPIVEFEVHQGKVRDFKPEQALVPQFTGENGVDYAAILSSRNGRERGVSLERLRRAYMQVTGR